MKDYQKRLEKLEKSYDQQRELRYFLEKEVKRLKDTTDIPNEPMVGRRISSIGFDFCYTCVLLELFLGTSFLLGWCVLNMRFSWMIIAVLVSPVIAVLLNLKNMEAINEDTAWRNRLVTERNRKNEIQNKVNRERREKEILILQNEIREINETCLKIEYELNQIR